MLFQSHLRFIQRHPSSSSSSTLHPVDAPRVSHFNSSSQSLYLLHTEYIFKQYLSKKTELTLPLFTSPSLSTLHHLVRVAGWLSEADVLIYVLLINHIHHLPRIRLQSSTHIDLLLLIKSNRICYPQIILGDNTHTSSSDTGRPTCAWGHKTQNERVGRKMSCWNSLWLISTESIMRGILRESVFIVWLVEEVVQKAVPIGK